MTLAFLKRSIAPVLAMSMLSACISEMPRFPSEPGPTAFQPAYTRVNASAPGRATPNRVKYRDSGMKPGRNSGAPLELRALRGSDGVTLVELSTGSFEEGPALIRIEKVQLKVPTAGLPTYNERPQSRTWSRTIQGLSAGDQVEATAHLRYASGPAVHVVTLNSLVARRPDVAVTTLAGPQRVYVNAPSTFIATVIERNGDVGAHANCLLTVNDVPVDQASRIWVDARGVVNCQFTYIFRTIGNHDLRVTLTGVKPTDDNVQNNAASMSVDVVTPGQPISFGTIQANDEAYTYTYESTRTGAYPISGSYVGSQMLSSLNFFGTTVDVSEKIERIDARLSADGSEIFTSSLTQLSGYEYDDGFAAVSCADYWVSGEQAQSCVSTYRNGTSSAWFSYAHSSGTVTYYGQTIYCHTMGCDTYTSNMNRPTGTGERYGVTFGSVLRVELKFVDAAGIEHVVDRSLTFQDFSADVNYDRSGCEPYFDGLGEICEHETSQGAVWRGLVTWMDEQ